MGAYFYVEIETLVGLDPKSPDSEVFDNIIGVLWAILYLRFAKPYCYMWPRLSQRGVELTFWYDTEVRPYLDADLAVRGLEMTDYAHAALRHRLIKLQLYQESMPGQWDEWLRIPEEGNEHKFAQRGSN